MKFVRLAAGLTLPAMMLAACGPNGLSKQDVGLGVGAVAGGVIGNQFGQGTGKVLATGAGILIGGIVGSEIGRSMDEQDRHFAQEAEFQALERGQSGGSTPWRNPDSGHYGMVVPSQAYDREGQNCRDYTHTVYMSGEPQTMRGTACRNPDGTWQNVS
ncbi:MAG: RT0821/Lpp0805 family surface protein [Hyphomicrobiaceae bacterium]